MRVNKKIAVAFGAIAVVSALTLAGCATGGTPKPPSGEKGASAKLTVWVDAERVDALQAAADSYQKKTGVAVELIGKSVDDMKDDFIQQVPTGKGPDIVMGANDWLGELSKDGVVAPLELGDSADNYLPVALQAATHDGTVSMLPYAIENIALLRNADLVPAAPTSFDDMLSKGSFVVEQGTDGNPYHLYPFQTAFGAPVFGTDASGSYDAADLQLGSDGGFAFADWLAAQGEAGTLNTDVDADIAKQQFLDGKAAFWLTGPWNVAAAVDAGINVAIDPIPSPTDQTASPFAGVKGFFVSSQSKNKVAANDFLVNYIGTEEVQLSLFKAGNVLPALTAAADTAASDPIIAGFQAVGADAVPMPAIPAMGAVWQFWGVTEAAIIKGKDPKATWQKLVDDVTAAIKKQK